MVPSRPYHDTVLDVLKDFLDKHPGQDWYGIPGRDLHELGKDVRQFALEYRPQVQSNARPVYLGGWPSASFWLAHGDMILTSLLYSEQVLVRDPVVDWFSDDQYRIPHLIAAHPGYLDIQTGHENIGRTRAFLASVVPALMSLRPLIESGLIALVPCESVFLRRAKEIEALESALLAELAHNTSTYSQRFQPGDIATEPNVRGLFVFTPGPDPDTQIRRAISHGLRYFAREFTLSREYGATYTAPFDHELFLCREGLDRTAGPSTRVVQAVLQSDLPIFTRLTPKLISEVHDSDSFSDFREQIYQLYSNVPLDVDPSQAREFLEDQERILLKPRLKAIEVSIDRGILGRIGLAMKNSWLGLAAGVGIDLLAGTPGLATTATALHGAATATAASRTTGPSVIWKALVRHGRTVGTEMRDVTDRPSASIENWGIPRESSMSVVISQGLIIGYGAPRPHSEQPREFLVQSTRPEYQPCPCGSSRKYKFCCYGVPGLQPVPEAPTN